MLIVFHIDSNTSWFHKSRLTFILLKWFSLFGLCGLYQYTNNHFLFLSFILKNIASISSSKPVTKRFDGIYSVFWYWYTIKMHLHESYDRACKDYSTKEYGTFPLERELSTLVSIITGISRSSLQNSRTCSNLSRKELILIWPEIILLMFSFPKHYKLISGLLA